MAKFRIAGLVAVLLVVDLATKELASTVDPAGLVSPVRNDGTILSTSLIGGMTLVAASLLVGSAGIALMHRLVRKGNLRSEVLAIGSAGFLGNLIDRVFLGSVRDWLVIGPTTWNIADFYLLTAIPTAVWIGIRVACSDVAANVSSSHLLIKEGRDG